MEDKLFIANDLKAQCNMSFYDDGNEIGRLTWDNGTLEFTGTAEDSARTFFDFLRPYVDQYIASR